MGYRIISYCYTLEKEVWLRAPIGKTNSSLSENNTSIMSKVPYWLSGAFRVGQP